MKTNASSLTPRQALIAAAVTGYKGEGPSSWPSPVPRSVIIDYARSYSPELSDAEFQEAFDQLTSEKCWTAIEYHRVFAEPYYYCHYWSEFLKELPDPLSDFMDPGMEGSVTKSSLRDLWDYLFEKFSDESGAAWLYWGLCAGQGSEGPSDSPWGPCLGPSCCWHKEGEPSCHWQLEFSRSSNVSFPDMSILRASNREPWSKVNQEQFIQITISAFRQFVPPTIT